MENAPVSVEEKIVLAAIDCIEQFGINGTTNRRIAAMAHVNSAAINYYFRSKEALVKRCMEKTLENAFGPETFDQLPKGTARERASALFNELIVGGLNYPGLTRSHFYRLFTEGTPDELLLEKMNSFVERLIIDQKQNGAALPGEELRLACYQVISAVMMVILAPRLFAWSQSMDMHAEKERKMFVDRLVDRLL
jgi:AcrR family transcriptional regulator